MLFNSIEFLLFLPTVVALYFALPVRHRWALLLAASFWFYASWKLEYLVLIIISIAIDYYAGLRMAGKETPEARRPYLLLSLFANLGILVGFKYFNFFSDSIRAAFEPFGMFGDMPHLEFLLPVGISFYTFQSMSYTIDVYRGERGPERHLGIFALYVSFFPQLVAGPIERSTHLLPQFKDEAARHFDYDRTASGLRLILWGFFKKIVIADQLALYVDQVYGSPGEWHGAAVLVATYFFAFQIFCDFSAYTDIARGSARIMGYDLMENFNRPYFSRSIREFWARWHISLSTWFRDYLYIPLGGNRVLKWRWYYNLMVVFVVSGLWHGANWTFVAWGFLHGAYLVLSLMTRNGRDRVWGALGRVGGTVRRGLVPAAIGPGGTGPEVPGNERPFPTFADDVGRRTGGWLGRLRLYVAGFPVREAFAMFFTFHLVVLSWVFFRADTIGDAFVLIGSLADFGTGLAELASSFEKFEYAPALLGVLVMESVHVVQERGGRSAITRKLLGMPGWARFAVYYALIMYMVLFGQYETAQQFIYFQF